jgi:hypothetical protein
VVNGKKEIAMILTKTGKTAFVLGLMLSVVGAGGVRAQSATACDAYARSYANDASRQGQILRGGAKGGLVGLGIGAIAGGAGVGAAIGGGLAERVGTKLHN